MEKEILLSVFNPAIYTVSVTDKNNNIIHTEQIVVTP
jgi:hypothetical protein